MNTQTQTTQPTKEQFNLHEAYDGFKLPDALLGLIKQTGKTMFGSKNFTKMVLFANQFSLNNDDIDYWMGLKPERSQEENYDGYKMRQRFQKALLKYRAYLYDRTSLVPRDIVRKQKKKAKLAKVTEAFELSKSLA